MAFDLDSSVNSTSAQAVLKRLSRDCGETARKAEAKAEKVHNIGATSALVPELCRRSVPLDMGSDWPVCILTRTNQTRRNYIAPLNSCYSLIQLPGAVN